MEQKSNGESAEKGIRSKITLVDMAGMDSVKKFDSENTEKKMAVDVIHSPLQSLFVFVRV